MRIGDYKTAMAYYNDTAVVERFIEDCIASKRDNMVPAGMLYHRFLEWTDHVISQRSFGMNVTRYIDKVRRSGVPYYVDIEVMLPIIPAVTPPEIVRINETKGLSPEVAARRRAILDETHDRLVQQKADQEAQRLVELGDHIDASVARRNAIDSAAKKRSME